MEMGTTPSLPALLTPAQLAKITGAHEESVRRGIRAGRLPALKINGRWFVKRDEVLRTGRYGSEEVAACAMRA
jgi:excisionase family DNA binding protein